MASSSFTHDRAAPRGPGFVAIRGVIPALGDDPHPMVARKIAGSAALWRVRVRIGGVAWRVIYQLRPDEHEVVVVRVARRDESTYRGLGW